MRRYFDEWSFKHPRPEDFVRIAERESGLVLDWYHDQWINTTKYPDVGIDSVWSDNRALTTVRLERRGSMAMPVDVKVTFESGASLTYTVPLAAMHGHKDSLRKDYEDKLGELDKQMAEAAIEACRKSRREIIEWPFRSKTYSSF